MVYFTGTRHFYATKRLQSRQVCCARIRQVESRRAVFAISRALYIMQSTDVGGSGGRFSLVGSAPFLGASNAHSIPLSLGGWSQSDVKYVGRLALLQQVFRGLGLSELPVCVEFGGKNCFWSSIEVFAL